MGNTPSELLTKFIQEQDIKAQATGRDHWFFQLLTDCICGYCKASLQALEDGYTEYWFVPCAEHVLAQMSETPKLWQHLGKYSPPIADSAHVIMTYCMPLRCNKHRHVIALQVNSRHSSGI